MGRSARCHPPQVSPLDLELLSDLQGLENKNLRRSLSTVSSEAIDFSSNDYLGLRQHPAVIRAAQAAVKKWGAGSGASRLLSGNLSIHEQLERSLSRFKKEEAALVFPSGYHANLGAVTALVGEQDVVLVDRLNHASLIDGARLSHAKLWVYPHLDLGRLQELLKKATTFRRRLVITDAYFSMDGDIAPLDKLLELCHTYHANLMIDEAHSTGVFGKSGLGLTEHFGLSGKIPVVMGTLSKALGSSGGYIAGSRVLVDTLINKAKPFVYTTAPVPAASAAALESIRILQEEADSKCAHSLRRDLWERTRQMREGLQRLGLDLTNSEGPIISILIGQTAKTLRIRHALEEKGFRVGAIRPPTVPPGTDRIRLSVSAKHSKRDIDRFLKVFAKVTGRRPVGRD